MIDQIGLEYIEDRLFCLYFTDLLIKQFELHTGHKVSIKQQNELERFLIKWTKDILSAVLKDKND